MPRLKSDHMLLQLDRLLGDRDVFAWCLPRTSESFTHRISEAISLVYQLTARNYKKPAIQAIDKKETNLPALHFRR